ncbi:eukaryotic translation initiation factor 4B3 [Chenopodium quinoa]|uniref:eukaryotic translation initiation factor 4B3 n=1 Tax=Chenopodium quinoa TaxID=63459 RepID=UPI000B782D0E|nr:eukaryotic translation initiation factor 4B3 [Chenopodium quinoa]
MAATVSSVWAKPGAWALDSEEHEDELTQQIMPQPTKPEPPAADFPSLAAAAAAKPKKKNKAQTLSLAEFSTYGSAAPKPKPKAFAVPQRLTQDEMLVLPTGPRERTAEELERPRLGGGFRNYGGGGANDNSRVRVSDRSSSRDRDMGPSRADEADDWSKTKKFSSFGGGAPERSDRREKVGFFNSSRADEVDNWASNKSFVAAPVDGPRRERRMGFESYSNGSDSGNWSKSKEERGGSVGGGGVEADTWGRRESIGAGGGGSGRPRLNLQPRTLPVVINDNVTPTEAAKGVNSGLSFTPTEVKAKGANPFGEARPREEVLAEKGKDWKEIDEKLESVKINGEKSEGFGRRGFGLGRSDSGDDVKSWRKPESADAVTSPPGSSVDTTENNATTAESTTENASESVEKVSEEN